MPPYLLAEPLSLISSPREKPCEHLRNTVEPERPIHQAGRRGKRAHDVLSLPPARKPDSRDATARPPASPGMHRLQERSATSARPIQNSRYRSAPKLAPGCRPRIPQVPDCGAPSRAALSRVQSRNVFGALSTTRPGETNCPLRGCYRAQQSAARTRVPVHDDYVKRWSIDAVFPTSRNKAWTVDRRGSDFHVESEYRASSRTYV